MGSRSVWDTQQFIPLDPLLKKHPLMKFNPLTNELFTDKGVFIKQLSCPLKAKWKDLAPIHGNASKRHCTACDNSILDTAYYDDETLLELLKEQPETCLKVNLNQHNIQVTSNGILE